MIHKYMIRMTIRPMIGWGNILMISISISSDEIESTGYTTKRAAALLEQMICDRHDSKGIMSRISQDTNQIKYIDFQQYGEECIYISYSS